jgi:hypothetical protein
MKPDTIAPLAHKRNASYRHKADDRKHVAWIDTNGCSKTFHEFSRDEKGNAPGATLRFNSM